MPQQLTRVQIVNQISALITNALNRQNTAPKVKNALSLIISNLFSSVDDKLPIAAVDGLSSILTLKADLVNGKVPLTQLPALSTHWEALSKSDADPQTITQAIAASIAALVNSSPAALDTLNELATALNNDPNFATTINNALSSKAPVISPTLQGIPLAPTALPTNNSLQIATTAFVKSALEVFFTGAPAFTCMRADGTENFTFTNIIDAINWTNVGGPGSTTYLGRPCVLANVAVMAPGTILDLQHQPINLNGIVIRVGNGGLIRNNRLSYAGRYSPEYGAAGDSFTIQGGTFAGKTRFLANPGATVIYDNVQLTDFNQSAVSSDNGGYATDGGRIILRNGSKFSAGHQPDPSTIVTTDWYAPFVPPVLPADRGKVLHANATTGALEWVVSSGGTTPTDPTITDPTFTAE